MTVALTKFTYPVLLRRCVLEERMVISPSVTTPFFDRRLIFLTYFSPYCFLIAAIWLVDGGFFSKFADSNLGIPASSREYGHGSL